MMYATCAKIGCNERIGYDETDYSRPRYCSYHESLMHSRLFKEMGDKDFWDDLNIVIHPIKPTIQSTIHQTVELRCPLCKLRITVPESKTGYKQACKTYGCEGMMIYHKDVEEK